MANGDAAEAAGLAVFAPTQDVREGYDNDNVRGDELAAHITTGGHPWSKISGKGPYLPVVTALATPSSTMARDSNGRSSVADPSSGQHVANYQYVEQRVASLQAKIDNLSAYVDAQIHAIDVRLDALED